MPGTICSTCYALKGNYRRGSVASAQQRRLGAINDPRWTDAMVFLLQRLHAKPIKVDLGEVGVRLQKQGKPRVIYVDPGWHRWHDSGDIQSVEHLRKICEVARRTPTIRHWLPTQELAMVKTYATERDSVIPPNLVIRVSDVGIDAPRGRDWPTTSGVVEKFHTVIPGTHICPAPRQDHKCGGCRACWNQEVSRVAYEMH